MGPHSADWSLKNGDSEDESPTLYSYPTKLKDTITTQEKRSRRRRANFKCLEVDNQREGGRTEYLRRGTMSGTATSATLDRVSFSLPIAVSAHIAIDEVSAVKRTLKKDKKMRWFVELPGNASDTLIDTNHIVAFRKNETRLDRQAKAYIFFHVRPKENELKGKSASHLASLLQISKLQAEHLIRKAPTLANAHVTDGVLSTRCIELSLLLQCTPQKLASVVKRCPSILTYQSSTLARKMIELDVLLSLHDVNDAFVGNEVQHVKSSTIAIANRVPTLLVSDIKGTLTRRSQELKVVLFGIDVDPETNRQLECVLRRCPELLLYDVTNNIAPKVHFLNTYFSRKARGSDDVGIQMARKEPRLLLYAVEKSLVPKDIAWRKRVQDPEEFDNLLFRYPTLLMYSLGSVARLEYFAYRNDGRKPDSREARKLLMMPLAEIEAWGDRESLSKMSSLLSTGKCGTVGRPRSAVATKLEVISNRIDDNHLLSYYNWIVAEVSELKLDTQIDFTLRQMEKDYGTLSCSQMATASINYDACLAT